VGESLHRSGENLHAFRTAANSAINPATDDIQAIVLNCPVGSLRCSPFTSAKSVNATGDIEGDICGPFSCGPPGYVTAFVYAGNTFTTNIAARAPFQGYADGITDQDQVVSSDGGGNLLVWQNGTVTQLADCKIAGLTPYCVPSGINNSVQVIGSAPQGAFIFTHGAVYNLNTLIPSGAGWHLDRATRINDSGQIIGLGDFNGTQHWFRLDPRGRDEDHEFNREEDERGDRRRSGHKNREFDRGGGEHRDRH
jgi:hypothetical protein